MPSKTSPLADFNFRAGQGFDFAYFNRYKLSFVTSGAENVVRVSTRGDLFTIVNQSEMGENELFAGSFDEVGEKFKAIQDAVFPKSCSTKTNWWKVLGVSLLVLLGATFLKPVVATAPQYRGPSFDQQLTPAQMRELLGVITGNTAPGIDPNKLPDIPVSPETTKTDTVPVSSGGVLGLPAYQPDLYKDGAAEKPKSAQPENPVPPPAQNPAAEAKPVADAKPVASAAPTGSDATALKNQVATSLKQSGMSKEDAERALREISMLSPSQLSEASLDSLPPNVRQLLLDQIAADKDSKSTEAKNTDESSQGGVPNKLIMLPQQVVDNYRGHDGISSLPENSSWQARGNPSVRLPLPGGGDIKSVDDLKAFGVQP